MREGLVGDPETGVIHGGVVTALLDTCAGVACINSPTKPQSVATLDLRIDYMRPATPRQTLLAHAVCHRETKLITFVRAIAFHEDPAQPVASAIARSWLSAAPIRWQNRPAPLSLMGRSRLHEQRSDPRPGINGNPGA